MKITQKIIDDLTVALAHTKKDGTENWKDLVMMRSFMVTELTEVILQTIIKSRMQCILSYVINGGSPI